MRVKVKPVIICVRITKKRLVLKSSRNGLQIGFNVQGRVIKESQKVI